MSEADIENDNHRDNPARPENANWAHPVETLKARVKEKNAPNRVDGKQLVGALQGFGPMWQKTYTIRLPGRRFTPAFIIKTWKENFGSFWPSVNRFYAPFSGIQPGEVALIKSFVPGGIRLSTGVMVIYTDEESFTFMTPQGHLFAGWVTFCAFAEPNYTRVEVQVLMRSADPLIEMGLRLGGHRAEDQFWLATLENLAKHLGIIGMASYSKICLDKKVQWHEVRNLRHNVLLGSTLYAFSAPLRWLGGTGPGQKR